MNFKNKYCLFFMLFSIATCIVNAQEEDELDTEVVNIVKPYTPTISDAFKVKETPVLNDSVSEAKKPVEYSIFSVPVASTFTPAKGKAATVEKAKPIKLYDNYATLGFGNYTSILGELYSNFEISRTDNAGFFFRHNSAQGDIEGVRLENKYYDTQLDANYTSRQRDAYYRLEAGGTHQLFNWYGLPDFYEGASEEFINNADVQQNYFGGYVGGTMAFDESIFEKLSARVRYTGDSYSSSEINATLQPEFSFPLTDFDLKITGDVDYVSGSFEKGYVDQGFSIAYSFLNAGITPAIQFVNNDLSVSLGVAAYVTLDAENSETEFNIYPQINASYKLVDELLIAYGGVDGGLDQNTYYNFKETNPYVSPTLFIAPTSRLYDGFAGLKGKLSNSVGYNVRGSYGKEENKALFLTNPAVDNTIDFEGYEYGNSFQIVYDDMNTLSVFGELKVAVSDVVSVGLNAEYFSYDTTNEMQPWNLPEIKASLFSDFKFNEQWYGGASVFYVGERMDRNLVVGPLVTPFPEEVALDGYADLNVHLGYKVNDRLSFFAKGSNLLSDNYEKWLNYPVQGIQGLLGATYKFDW
ncbi:TonB-dependent receptor [Cochleicola gelatinilyticus]|uniref:TonB-dependent receptor n=2 Tax=Cochleicola gelatinilyticus TaxID=1763537 RepID=A0A167KGH0_9FLAO|nr:TonB-dependent receptor [Cochleicola gelatinilyticus]